MFMKERHFNILFIVVVIIFIVSVGSSLTLRGGRDLKVGLFGVVQTLHHKSPYEHIRDPERPLFRYAPGLTLLQRPFLLTSVQTGACDFDGMFPSIMAWHAFILCTLAASGKLLLKLIPAATPSMALRNLKISFLLASPFIGYELCNSQNKLLALFFVLMSVWLFEEKRHLFSAIFLNLAMTVYIPLAPFSVYFILRSKGRYFFPFLLGVLIVFGLVPSLFWGFDFNWYLLQDWYNKCLDPFLGTVVLKDFRASSQSLPSAIIRMLIVGDSYNFCCMIPPQALAQIIRYTSFLMILFSCLAVLRPPAERTRGLSYSIFFILALMIPTYCVYYTWAWLFVFYLAVLNYISFPDTPASYKRLLLNLGAVQFLGSFLMWAYFFKFYSFLGWSTLFLWAGMVGVLISEAIKNQKS